MVLFLLPGLRPHWKIAQANIEKQELFTPKKTVGDSGRKFPLPPHILPRLNLHNSCNSFPSNSSSAPSLLPSLMEDSPTSLHSADSGSWSGKRPAEGTADERPGKKAKYGLASHIGFEERETDADDEDSDFDSADTPSDREEEITWVAPPATVPEPIAEPSVASPFASPSPSNPESESDFSDTPSSKRRALTPPSPTPEPVVKTAAKPIPATGRWDFTLTAKQAGYVYNPRKSMTDLSDRFATPSDSDNTLHTDDSESDFNSTPNRSSSPARARASSPSPLPLPLPQWKYHYNPIDRNNPTTPPSIGTKRKMEQAYAEWHQEEMDTPRAPSYSPITLPADTPQSIDLNEVESGPAKYDSPSQQENIEPSRAPSYSHHTISSSSPQTHSSPSIPETTIFPTDLPSPSVPCRLEPHSPILDHLTAQYIAQGPHPQVSHVNHAAVNQRNASQILSKHQDDRAPFVRAASRRLQAVVGVRNDLPFDLLMGMGRDDACNLVVGREGTLVDLGLKGLGREEGVRGGGNENGEGEDLAEREDGVMSEDDVGNGREDMSTNMHMNTNTHAKEAYNTNTTAQYLQDIRASFDTLRSSSNNPSHPSSSHHPHHQKTARQSTTSNPTHESPTPTQTTFFPPSVNPHTGEGLRAYLLSRASITGSVKRECRSISFHDFTPNVRTGEFRNQLLVHFGVDGMSSCERVEVMELGLPDITGTLHPWLSIFIQRPLVTTSIPTTSTSTTSTTPPNFPKPTPTTWLCLAVPLSNVTTYPIQPDTSLPLSLLEPTFSHTQRGLPTKKIAKRQDYDFSFQGVPIFEFSTRTLFPQPENQIPFSNTAPTGDFLSVEVPRPYDPSDPYHPFPAQVSQNPGLLQRETRKYAREAGVKGEELHTYGDMITDESGVDISEEVSPNEGIWWCEFYRGITRDRIRWERVKRCMGRGRCRVVLRWQDVPDEMKRLGGRSSSSSTSSFSSATGVGVSGRSSEAERIMQEMSRENTGGIGKKRRGKKSLQTSHANTISCSSTRLGLGLDANVGSHSYSHMRSGSSDAMRESLRARAMGNRMSFNGGV